MTQPNDPNAPYSTQPTTQTDLEARRKANYGAPVVEVDVNETNAPYAVEDNDTAAYVGVDADKMTYANDTEKPLAGDGVEDEVAKEMQKGYAYAGTPEQPESNQTVGGGSQSPVLAVTSSGENVKHELVKSDSKESESKDGENVPAKAAPRPATKPAARAGESQQ